MSSCIEPNKYYDGWVEGLTRDRYCTRLLLDGGGVVVCEADRDREHESPDAGPEHHRNDPVRLGHVMFEVDSKGVAVLHGDFVAVLPRPVAAA